MKCSAKGCKKKITLLDQEMKCKCEKTFCKIHRHSFNHHCEFDFYQDNQNNTNLPKVIPSKITPI
jgi:hypothetical protein